MESMGEGAASGAAVGGLTGLALGLAALAIPGVGPIFAAGPIAVALGGAGAGALAGGLLGSLTDMGVSEEDAHGYTEAVRQGNVIVLVEADEVRMAEIKHILHESGALDVSTKAEAWNRDGWSGYQANMIQSMTPVEEHVSQIDSVRREDAGMSYREDQVDTDKVTVPVVSEELVVEKREVETGGVAVHRRVVTVPVEEEVRLREERVTVERRAVDRPADVADFNDSPEEIRLAETVEEPIVHKRARVVEEIVLGKEVNERSQRISDEVRRTEVRVEDKEREHRQ